MSLRQWLINCSRDPTSAFGAGSERLMPNCALFVRSNMSWLEMDPAMCSLSATAASVLSCIVIILVLRLIETCDQPAGGGYFFAFTEKGRRGQHSWRRIEDL